MCRSRVGSAFFCPDETGDTEAARKCPACEDGSLGLNFGRFGAFIACSNYPTCRYTRELGGKISEPGAAAKKRLPKNPWLYPKKCYHYAKAPMVSMSNWAKPNQKKKAKSG